MSVTINWTAVFIITIFIFLIGLLVVLFFHYRNKKKLSKISFVGTIIFIIIFLMYIFSVPLPAGDYTYYGAKSNLIFLPNDEVYDFSDTNRDNLTALLNNSNLSTRIEYGNLHFQDETFLEHGIISGTIDLRGNYEIIIKLNYKRNKRLEFKMNENYEKEVEKYFQNDIEILEQFDDKIINSIIDVYDVTLSNNTYEKIESQLFY